MYVFTVLLIVFVIVSIYGLIEYYLHHKRIYSIPIRIHINGTRGKSSVTRLIGAALREAGIKTITKVTGTYPRLILENGCEVGIYRKAGANIIEQLSIVKEIIETKEIELPISKGGTETILVAEDDDMVRKFMREVLEGAGYTVIEAKDGEDAIKVFIENKDRIQLLILDVLMPKKNGKEVYETLKESNPYIRAFFTGGYSADILHKKGIISEGPEVILKPISSDKLLSKIRDLLDQ